MKVELAKQNGESRIACFSEDMLYRYSLDIVWAPGPILTTIGLNPSTATHLKNDNTISRGIGFAKSYGCGGYRMLNAFAWRSTDRSVLRNVRDPIGPENTLEFLKSMATEMTIACWGTTIQEKTWRHYYRGHDISEAIPGLLCFRKTEDGHPHHPLRLPADLKPVPFTYA